MEDDDFELQLKLEREEVARAQLAAAQGSDPYTFTDPDDGTVYEWDADKRAWFPKINEDFIAMYQANYGYSAETDEHAQEDNDKTEAGRDKQDSKQLKPESVQSGSENILPSTSQPGPEISQDISEPQAEVAGSRILKTKGLKNAAQKRPASWFEMDDAHNTKVYVSGLPTSDFDEVKFVEMMSKYGLVFKDETGRYKVKLYRGPDGQLKGDGLCTYLKVESVDLAIKLLDGSSLNDKQIHVERAKFQLKGQFDPSKKPKQLKKKDKEKLKKKIDKLFAWKPEKLRGERKKCENTVVIRNFFEPKDFDEDARLILEYQNDLREECAEKFGPVKKVIIYDRNPEGIATVTFNEVGHADACIATMKGRFFAGRQLDADPWDGKEKFKIIETEDELEQRLKKWDEFLDKD